MTENTVKQKNITIDDVRNIINDEENEINILSNASAIRTALGKGSFSTIQKFLNKIRAEAKSENVDDLKNDGFELNKEALENIIKTIKSSVNITVLEKLNILHVEKDDLLENLNIVNNDNASLVEEIENIENDMDNLKQSIIEIKNVWEERENAFENEIISLQGKLDEAHKNNEEMKAMFEKFMNKSEK